MDVRLLAMHLFISEKLATLRFWKHY